MTTLALNSNPDSTNLSVPKLRDDGSNWADYSPRIQKALGSKELWRHVEGTAIAPKPYALVDGVPVLSDGKTPASEEQIEARETRIIDFKKRENSHSRSSCQQPWHVSVQRSKIWNRQRRCGQQSRVMLQLRAHSTYSMLSISWPAWSLFIRPENLGMEYIDRFAFCWTSGRAYG